MKEQIILGIDPGSRCTGYAIICVKGDQFEAVDHGFFRCVKDTLGERLYYTYEQLSLIIERYKPDQAAVEQVFTSHNPQSASNSAKHEGRF